MNRDGLVGQVATVLGELQARLIELGSSPSDGVECDPRKLVFVALRDLKNNAERMRYDHHCRQGLPMMTSAVESVIKMINRRVKGSEKFWSEPGAEAILQVRADSLS